MSALLLIKELRERTGAGFLDCKKAIAESGEDIDKAIAWLQERGAAKAAKKAGAIAAEGITNIVKSDNGAAIYELNSQTDFVIQNALFIELNDKIGKALASANFTTSEEANAVSVDGKTVAELCTEATAVIGEKIELRRATKVNLTDGQVIGTYVHVNKQVSAVLVTEGGTEEAAKNVAMHIASMSPEFLDEASLPAEKVAEMKKEIMESDTIQNKPEDKREMIAAGMLRKALSSLTLVDQEFVMEKMPVSKYLANANAKAVAMFRFEVGEGIEKKEEDFAAEVAAQMAG